MLDPRFANAGAAPFVAGFGAQQVPMSYRHHRHHKHRSRKDQSPLSRDESIHKVDHGQTHAFQQNDGAPFSAAYNVPFNVGMYHHQQTPYYGPNICGFTSQFPNFQYGFAANQTTAPAVAHHNAAAVPPGSNIVQPNVRHHHHHRRHHRHHRNQLAETNNPPMEGIDQVQAVPEPLIGQRSSSVVGDDATGPTRSPAPADEGETQSDQPGTHQYRHRHHQHAGERVDGSHRRKKYEQNQQASNGDGYGHINNDLIFIERGDLSPHRQNPPPGYEYKGKIEVQGATREHRSRSRGREIHSISGVPPVPAPLPPPVAPAVNVGLCPPGWHQVIIPGNPGGQIQPTISGFPGQIQNATGFGTTGFQQQSTVTTGTNGLANLAATLPIPPQGQIVADYIVDAGETHVGTSSTTHESFTRQQQHGNAIRSPSATFHEHIDETHEYSTVRPTIIEVWQKRPKSGTNEKPGPAGERSEQDRSQSREHSQSHSRSQPRSRSRHRSRSHSPRPSQSVDFDRFRNEILNAIERIAKRSGSAGHDGGTQTHPAVIDSGSHRQHEQRTESNTGEVRVIVQPIQPVFYMPRQGTTGATTPQYSGSSTNFQPQPSGSSGAPNVVYVPRNVYVPVIKPVFVPRERVIVRPQVIHVARPVLVDRPVPVTQRPIIIDRERPVPVPIRSGGQGSAQASGSNVVREEYVYRDNLPVAYGGRCAEFAGGVNYGYMPTQQDAQYAASSTQEVTSTYQAQAPVMNMNVTDQYNASQSNSHLEVQQDVASFHGSYSNLAQSGAGTSTVNVEDLNQSVLQQTIDQTAQAAGLPPGGPAQIEILDTTVNPYWQKTDQSSLVRRYGRPAYEIVNKTDQVEQQMYTELRRQSGGVDIQRSVSSASYGSGIGLDGVGGIPQY